MICEAAKLLQAFCSPRSLRVVSAADVSHFPIGSAECREAAEARPLLGLHIERWVWLRFWSLSPFAKVPFRYHFVDRQPGVVGFL